MRLSKSFLHGGFFALGENCFLLIGTDVPVAAVEVVIAESHRYVVLNLGLHCPRRPGYVYNAPPPPSCGVPHNTEGVLLGVHLARIAFRPGAPYFFKGLFDRDVPFVILAVTTVSLRSVCYRAFGSICYRSRGTCS